MLAVGEKILAGVDKRMVKMTTGLGGGIGSTHQYVCGAFSSGVSLIGARFGRTTPDIEDGLCQEKVRAYQDEFQSRLGSVICRDLREEKYGSGGEGPCSVLVERAASLLLKVLQ